MLGSEETIFSAVRGKLTCCSTHVAMGEIVIAFTHATKGRCKRHVDHDQHSRNKRDLALKQAKAAIDIAVEDLHKAFNDVGAAHIKGNGGFVSFGFARDAHKTSNLIDSNMYAIVIQEERCEYEKICNICCPECSGQS
jgi:hypothetical protein